MTQQQTKEALIGKTIKDVHFDHDDAGDVMLLVLTDGMELRFSARRYSDGTGELEHVAVREARTAN